MSLVDPTHVNAVRGGAEKRASHAHYYMKNGGMAMTVPMSYPGDKNWSCHCVRCDEPIETAHSKCQRCAYQTEVCSGCKHTLYVIKNVAGKEVCRNCMREVGRST